MSNVRSGIADTTLDGKLTPNAFIVNGATGQCKEPGFTRHSTNLFCRETCGDGLDFGKYL